MTLTRRHFIQRSAAFAAGFAGLHRLTACAAPPPPAAGAGAGYGPLLPDPARIMDLPEGFRYTVISRIGEEMDDGLLVPGLHDGMAAFPGPDGRTLLVRNHEIEPQWRHLSAFGPKLERLARLDPARVYDAGRGRSPGLGGTTTLVFDTRTQRLERHFLSLAGTTRNCAGGPTPWGTWLTCEEDVTRASGNHEKDHGYVFEVPASPEIALADPAPLTAMGRFYHEAVAVDPATGTVYLSEDRPDGLLYRYTPRTPGRLADGGRLQALAIAGRRSLDTRNWDAPSVTPGKALPAEWIDLDGIDSPKDDLRDRGFAAGAARFARAEGMWCAGSTIYFCCTNGGLAKRGQIWALKPGHAAGADRLSLFIEPNDHAVMNMCDNVTAAPWGDLVVCEDCGGINRILGVTPEGRAYTIGRTTAARSELAGVTFSPDGTTLFVNLQQDGLTLAITGGWRA